MKNYLLVFIAYLSFGSSAQAGFMVEPYVGYAMGAVKQPDFDEIKLKHVFYGGRLGYRLLGLKLGLDYQAGSGTAKQTGEEGDYEHTDLGAFVGYEFPMLMQVYATYFFQSKAKLNPEFDPEDFTGDAVRLGIGWTGLPYLSVNLELIMRKYKKYGSDTLNGALEGNSTALSISIPLP